MYLEHLRDTVQKFGLPAALHDLACRAADRAAEAQLLQGLVLTTEALDRSYLRPRDGQAWGFLARDGLHAAVRMQALDLTPAFIDDAWRRGDQCFGVMVGDTLASYGWYTRQPTPVCDGVVLRFDPAYAYMYKGFTLPAFRGQRLHGVGMALALEALTALGSKGLVSYVRSNNFASLKSCFRMGYREFGHLAHAKIRGRYLTFATEGCARYGFRLEAVARDRATGRGPS